MLLNRDPCRRDLVSLGSTDIDAWVIRPSITNRTHLRIKRVRSGLTLWSPSRFVIRPKLCIALPHHHARPTRGPLRSPAALQLIPPPHRVTSLDPLACLHGILEYRWEVANNHHGRFTAHHTRFAFDQNLNSRSGRYSELKRARFWGMRSGSHAFATIPMSST